jgi:hypothetical protein
MSSVNVDRGAPSIQRASVRGGAWCHCERRTRLVCFRIRGRRPRGGRDGFSSQRGATAGTAEAEDYGLLGRRGAFRWPSQLPRRSANFSGGMRVIQVTRLRKGVRSRSLIPIAGGDALQAPAPVAGTRLSAGATGWRWRLERWSPRGSVLVRVLRPQASGLSRLGLIPTATREMHSRRQRQ